MKLKIEPATESDNLSCLDCSHDFSVTYEPNYVGMSKAKLREEGGFKTATINNCPFCGSDNITDNS